VYKRYINNQKGVVPILFLVAAIGLIGFIVAANSADFKGGIFADLFPKPSSNAEGLPSQASSQAELVISFKPGTTETTKANIRKHYGLTKMTDVTTNGPEKDKIPAKVRDQILALIAKNSAVESVTISQ
jgi:hypothetical protein